MDADPPSSSRNSTPPATAFVGRERELAELRELLGRDDVRLVVLTGAGGVGKTRLAIRLVDQLRAARLGTVAFVPLANVRDPALVPEAIVRALDIESSSESSFAARLARHFGEHEFLLVLDNFEQVAPAAGFLAELLDACPHLTLLVTSRALLRLAAERVVTVLPLSLPDRSSASPSELLETVSGADAVQLFVARAQSIRADFALTEANAAAVADICIRLDGLPLAIELAAARSLVLPPAAMLARMDRRLPLLVGDRPDSPTRQQTMRNAIAWSVDLLSDAARALFRRMSVFLGGFTLDAAEWMAAAGWRLGDGPQEPEPGLPGSRSLSTAVVDGLESLVSHSLLRPVGEVAGEPWLSMLETIREFGSELLYDAGEERFARDRHAAWFVALAERAEPELIGPNQAVWVARLTAELGNLRSALSHLQAIGDIEGALRLAGASGWFWSSPGLFHEGRDLFAALVSAPDAANHPASLAKALASAGDIYDWLGEPDRALAAYERALHLYRELGDHRGIISMTRGLGSVAIDQLDYARARSALTESLDAARSSGDTWEASASASLLSAVALATGHGDRAISLAEQALSGWRELGDGGHILTGTASLGVVALIAGDPIRARQAYAEALDLAVAAEDRWHIARCVSGIAALAAGQGDYETAARLLAVSDREEAAVGAAHRPHIRAAFDRIRDQVCGALGDESGELVRAQGMQMSTAAAVDQARETVRALSLQQSSGNLNNAHGLSRRELEVLRLVADGFTDRQIAEHLFISRRTASKHVESILAKLDAPSRSAAASGAVRLGLI